MKVMTVVSGIVPVDRQEDFETSYRAAKGAPRPPGLEMSFLLKSSDGSGTYTIQSLWSSREALEAMRSSTKPRAVAMFEEAGVTPKVTILEVTESLP